MPIRNKGSSGPIGSKPKQSAPPPSKITLPERSELDALMGAMVDDQEVPATIVRPDDVEDLAEARRWVAIMEQAGETGFNAGLNLIKRVGYVYMTCNGNGEIKERWLPFVINSRVGESTGKRMRSLYMYVWKDLRADTRREAWLADADYPNTDHVEQRLDDLAGDYLGALRTKFDAREPRYMPYEPHWRDFSAFVRGLGRWGAPTPAKPAQAEPADENHRPHGPLERSGVTDEVEQPGQYIEAAQFTALNEANARLEAQLGTAQSAVADLRQIPILQARLRRLRGRVKTLMIQNRELTLAMKDREAEVVLAEAAAAARTPTQPGTAPKPQQPPQDEFGGITLVYPPTGKIVRGRVENGRPMAHGREAWEAAGVTDWNQFGGRVGDAIRGGSMTEADKLVVLVGGLDRNGRRAVRRVTLLTQCGLDAILSKVTAPEAANYRDWLRTEFWPALAS